MKRAAFFLAGFARVLIGGCATRMVLPGHPKTGYVPVEQCAAAGGTVMVVGGLAPGPACVIRNPDANKACTDSSQCRGRCLYTHDGPGSRLAPGAKATGSCEPANGTFGCFAEVRGGRLTSFLCVD